MKCLTLSGWGQQAASLSGIVPKGAEVTYLSYSALKGAEALFSHIKTKKLSADVLVGWSLGGQLAARIVEKGLIRPKLLVLLAAPYQYVADSVHPYGVNQFLFWTFCQSFRSFPSKTMQHFMTLVAHGDDHMREMIRHLNIDAENLEEWADWLDELGNFSGETLSFKKFPPTLIVHGKADQVVPVDQASIWKEHIPGSRVELIDFCGHAPHLHAPEKIRQWISDELKKNRR